MTKEVVQAIEEAAREDQSPVGAYIEKKMRTLKEVREAAKKLKIVFVDRPTNGRPSDKQ